MGTTAEKLQKALANKQSLVDIVNSKAGTSYTINSKPSDIVETINAQWGEGGGIDGVTLDGTELIIDKSNLDGIYIDNYNITYNVADKEVNINNTDDIYYIAINSSGVEYNQDDCVNVNCKYLGGAKTVNVDNAEAVMVNGGGIEYYKDAELYIRSNDLNTKHIEMGLMDSSYLILEGNYCSIDVMGNNNEFSFSNLKETETVTIHSNTKGIIYIDDTPLNEYGGGMPEGLTYEYDEVIIDTNVLRVNGTTIKGSYVTIHTEGTTNLTINTTVYNNNISKVTIDNKQLTPDMIAEGVTLFGITGTYKGSGSSATVEGNTLVVSGTVEDNTLTLSSGSVENKTLKL